MPKAGYRNLLRRYERYASDYDRRFARYSEATLNKALELTPDINGDLLDVACGTGLFEIKLRQTRPGLRLTGIDISPQMLDKARHRFDGDEQVQFLLGTAEHLPVEDAAFDIVACNNAFHLVQDAAAALREFSRVLRPNGRLLMIDWCLDYPQVLLMDMILRVADGQVRNIRTEDAMAELLNQADFEVTHRERFRVPPMWGLMALTGRKI